MERAMLKVIAKLLLKVMFKMNIMRLKVWIRKTQVFPKRSQMMLMMT